jgi:hypothetical protein
MDEKADSMAKIKTKTFEQKKEFAVRGMIKKNYIKLIFSFRHLSIFFLLSLFIQISKNQNKLWIAVYIA